MLPLDPFLPALAWLLDLLLGWYAHLQDVWGFA